MPILFLYISLLTNLFRVWLLSSLAIIKMSVWVDVWSLKLNIDRLHVSCMYMAAVLAGFFPCCLDKWFLKCWCWWIGLKVGIQGHARAALNTDSLGSVGDAVIHINHWDRILSSTYKWIFQLVFKMKGGSLLNYGISILKPAILASIRSLTNCA